jgi:purine nucleoside phosphorylase
MLLSMTELAIAPIQVWLAVGEVHERIHPQSVVIITTAINYQAPRSLPMSWRDGGDAVLSIIAHAGAPRCSTERRLMSRL